MNLQIQVEIENINGVPTRVVYVKKEKNLTVWACAWCAPEFQLAKDPDQHYTHGICEMHLPKLTRNRPIFRKKESLWHKIFNIKKVSLILS
jgi:hypothetical protein